MNRLSMVMFLCAWGAAGTLHAQFTPQSNSNSGGFQPQTNSNGAFFGSPVGGNFTTVNKNYDVEKLADKKYKVVPKTPTSPTAGPQDFYVYKNSRGAWKLPPTNANPPLAGTAKYNWFDGSANNDQLTFIAYGQVTDNGGYYIPQGQKVNVWAYMSSDNSGNTIFFYFGVDPFNAPQGERYPMYWSWEDPGSNPNIQRFLSDTGTSRL